MPPLNIRLVLAYDGGAYLGWQETKTGPSIEGALQAALHKMFQQPIKLQAASRTDAGVHAKGQVVNFLLERDLVDTEILCRSLNGLLPKDIVVRSATIAESDFHPTLNSIGKRYRYQVCNAPFQLPHKRYFSWHFPYSMDLEMMRNAAKHLIVETDFSAFCNVKKDDSYEHHIRRITRVEIMRTEGNSFIFEVEGNHFLYKMARNIVGTLCYIGCGKLAIDDFLKHFSSGVRAKLGITAPAHGLTLDTVFFSKI